MLLIALLILLVTACNQQKPFPETQEGIRAIDEATTELMNKYPEVIKFSANVYDTSDKLVRIAIRFEDEKSPTPSTQEKIINDLLNDIALRVHKTDWKPLFKDVEVDIMALSANENNKDEEILLATKKKNSTQLEFVN